MVLPNFSPAKKLYPLLTRSGKSSIFPAPKTPPGAKETSEFLIISKGNGTSNLNYTRHWVFFDCASGYFLIIYSFHYHYTKDVNIPPIYGIHA